MMKLSMINHGRRWWLTALAVGVLLALFAFGAQAKAADLTVHPTQAAAAAVQDDGGGDGGGGGDHGNPPHAQTNRVIGTVNMTPTAGLVGVWVVDSKNYTTTATTEFNQDHGTLEIGACVQMKVSKDGSNTVQKIGTVPAYFCNHGGGSGDDGQPTVGKGEFFGLIQVLPDGYPTVTVGIWQIGNLTVTVDSSTELKPQNGEFAISDTVKVEFVVQSDGSFLAREIKAVFTQDPGDDHGHGKPHHPGHHQADHEGKAFGVLDVTPTLPVTGTDAIWQISGISYTVTITTDLHNDAANFTAGKRVRVQYYADDAGNRIATDIKIAGPGGDLGVGNDLRIIGVIDQLPADGAYLGDWVISGITVSVTTTTSIKQENGAPAVGSFVEVTYVISDGVKVATRIETRVPPGCGDKNFVGKIEQMDSPLATSMAASVAAGATTWVIGGQSVVVAPATIVNGNLSDSSLVAVNSYIDASGQQVATRISGVTLSAATYMPLIASPR